MFTTIDEAVTTLNATGWTEIDNQRAGTYRQRGGTLAVLTHDENDTSPYHLTAITMRLASAEELSQWAQANGPIPEGSVLSLMFGAKTGRMIRHTDVATIDGTTTPRVWWSPLETDELVPEDTTTTESTTSNRAQAAGPGKSPGPWLGGAASAAQEMLYSQAKEWHQALEVFIAAGFTRDEAFELVRESVADYLAHQTLHCVNGDTEDEDDTEEGQA